MSARALLTTSVTALLAFALLSSSAQAHDHDHDHEGNKLTLEVVGVDETASPDRVTVKENRQKGTTYPPDIDGYVPTSYGGDCHDNVLAYASWHSVGDWYIVYDKCEMERYGAGQNDWDRVGAHEKAHTDGWGHGEEPRALNAAFDPGIVICRC